MKRIVRRLLILLVLTVAVLSGHEIGSIHGDAHAAPLAHSEHAEGVSADHHHHGGGLGDHDRSDVCPGTHAHCCCISAFPTASLEFGVNFLSSGNLRIAGTALLHGELPYPPRRPPRSAA